MEIRGAMAISHPFIELRAHSIIKIFLNAEANNWEGGGNTKIEHIIWNDLWSFIGAAVLNQNLDKVAADDTLFGTDSLRNINRVQTS